MPFALPSLARTPSHAALPAALALGVVLCSPACRRADARASSSSEPGLSVSVPASASSLAGPVDSAGVPMYEEGSEPPAVSLSGKSNRKDPAASASKRIGAIAMLAEIRQAPSPNARVLGYLRAGGIVDAGDQPAGREGCSGGWYKIQPFGYVCNGPSATLDMGHDVLRIATRRPDTESLLPYLYGIVRKPGPMYAGLPSREQAVANEPGLAKHIDKWLHAEDENGAGFRSDYWTRGVVGVSQLDAWDQKRTDELLSPLQVGKFFPGNLSGLVKDKSSISVGTAKHHNGFAVLDTFLAEGRRYALTTELVAVPVDRLRPIQGSTFHGYQIPEEIDFPFALIRVENVWGYRSEKGKLVKTKQLPRRSAVKLTGKQNFFNGKLHFETADGLWVSDREASRLDPAKRMPAWGKNGERWMDINVTKQTLVAYEGTKAVFATLVSTGEAGLGDPEKTKSTKRGIFRIHTKHLSATMNSDVTGEEFELQDIPYVQYFEGGYALHAAYWHDDFGKPRSHGCINLAPEDARRLFFWTEPKVPPGWHSVLRPLTGSVLFVHP
jgi:hypothetical protein